MPSKKLDLEWTIRREFARRYDGFHSWEQLAEIKAHLLSEVSVALEMEEQYLREEMQAELDEYARLDAGLEHEDFEVWTAAQ
jgi:hypothetical protein